METIQLVVDIFLHIDEHLNIVITNYGAWTYGLLILIIFLETGFVVTPFLPGDSLLFAAGVGAMPYGRFIFYNVFGAFIWTGLFISFGYYFGKIPFVRHNFEIVIPAIILISILPMVVEYMRGRAHGRRAKETAI